MLETSGEHLSPDQISSLVEATGPSGSTPANSSPLGMAQEHVAQCPQCASLVASQQKVAAALLGLEVKVSSKRSASCPREEQWLNLAGGLIEREEAALLSQHAATCDCCGPLLRAAMEDFNPELTPQELAAISQLRSAEPEWQRALAARMSAKSRGGAATKGIVEPQEPWWKFLSLFRVTRGMQWAATMAALLVLAGASWLWLSRSPRLDQASQLNAQAYRDGKYRLVALRWQGAPHGEYDEKRGGEDAQSANSQNALAAASRVIERGLDHNPDDPHWLQQSARLDLLEHNSLSALAKLQPLVKTQPDDLSLRIDEASAYFEQFENSGRDHAIDDLKLVLASDPNNQVALFNLATIYHALGKTSEEAAAWERYLQLDVDPNSPWAREARTRLSKLTQGSTVK